MIFINIVELVYPGTWLKMSNDDSRQEIQKLLLMVESVFTEASLSFNLFQSIINIEDEIPRSESLK